MTASMPASEFSLCQTKRADCPRTSLTTWSASWSQLEAGNCKTAKFISFNLEPVIFNDRVAENLVAGVVNLFPPSLLVGPREVDFQILAHMNRADALVAHVFEGVLHRFALRVENGFFGRDDYSGFHVNQ